MKKEKVPLLLAAIEYLKTEPSRFDMADGIAGIRVWRNGSLLEEPPCGTACCYAGSVAIVSGRIELSNSLHTRQCTSYNWWDVRKSAVEALELTEDEAESLFLLKHQAASGMSQRHWPEPFDTEYMLAKTSAERVWALERRVQHFIAMEVEA